MRPSSQLSKAVAHILFMAASLVSAAAAVGAQAIDAGDVQVFSWDNGDVFKGAIRDGLPNGPGTLTTRGRTYSGDWKDGCLTLPSGRRFVLFTTFDKCPPGRRPRLPRIDLH